MLTQGCKDEYSKKAAAGLCIGVKTQKPPNCPSGVGLVKQVVVLCLVDFLPLRAIDHMEGWRDVHDRVLKSKQV
jgi:hypothetical protein